MGPNVSKAIRMIVWVWANDWYFNSFRFAAPSAAAPAVDGVAAGKQISLSQGVGDCDVPGHTLANLPWDLRQSIWMLPVRPQETDRFLNCRHVGAAKRSVHEVV